MNYKLYILIIAFIASAKTYSQSTTDTVLYEGSTDGTNWISTQSTVINYNDACLITQSTDLLHSGIRWDSLYRFNYVYNTEGQPIEVTSQEWLNATQGWRNISRYHYYYSNDGLTDTIVEQSWSISRETWIDYHRQIYEHNTQGLEIYYEQAYYNLVWTPASRSYNTYDGFNRLLSQVSQNFINNNWVNKSKQHYTYQNDSAMTYSYLWNTNTNSWYKTYRDFYNFLGHTSKVESSLSQNLSENTWNNQSKRLSRYNTDSLVTTNFYNIWWPEFQEWRNYSRERTGYYDDNVVKRFTFQLWNTITNTWDNIDRVSYTNHGCAVSAELKAVNQNDALVEQEKNQPVIHNGSSYAYIFNNTTTGNNPAFKLLLTTGKQHKIVGTVKQSAVIVTPGSIDIFPNPARNYFTVDIKDAGKSFLIITNIAGKQVLQQSLKSGTQQVNITALQRGFYIVSITTNGQVKNQKLLVE
jgi:hypothetical protein